MKRIAFLALLVLPVWASAQGARTINFESLAFEVGKTSTGVAFDSSFTFELGSFGSFTPTAANESQWAANFQSLGQTSWDDALMTNFSGSVQLPSNASPFATTQPAFVWGFNSKSIGANTQWILLTNNSWTFPDTSVFGFPVTFTADSSNGTTAILGAINASGSDPYLLSSAVAVPEPATYAAVLGAMVLGVVGYRRFRRR